MTSTREKWVGYQNTSPTPYPTSHTHNQHSLWYSTWSNGSYPRLSTIKLSSSRYILCQHSWYVTLSSTAESSSILSHFLFSPTQQISELQCKLIGNSLRQTRPLMLYNYIIFRLIMHTFFFLYELTFLASNLLECTEISHCQVFIVNILIPNLLQWYISGRITITSHEVVYSYLRLCTTLETIVMAVLVDEVFVSTHRAATGVHFDARVSTPSRPEG